MRNGFRYIGILFLVIILLPAKSNAIIGTRGKPIIQDIQFDNHFTSFDSCQHYLSFLRDSAEKNSDTFLLAVVKFNYGVLHQLQGDNQQAERLYREALALFESLENKLGIAKCEDKLGGILRYRGQFDKAIERHWEALQVFRTFNDTNAIIDAMVNLGIAFRMVEDEVKAKELYDNAYKLSVSSNSEMYSTVCNSLGSFYWFKGDADSALLYYNQALQQPVLSLLQKERKCAILNNIGNVYRTKNDIEKALRFYKESLTLSQQYGMVNLEAITLKNLGRVSLVSNHLKDALNYFNRGIELSEKSGLKNTLLELYEQKSILLEQMGDFRQSLDLHKKFVSLGDSISKEDQQFRIAVLEQDYEIQQLEKEKVEMRNELVEKNFQLMKSRIYFVGLIFFISLLSLVFLLFYYRYRSGLKHKIELQNLNSELESKVKRRTQSLYEEIEGHKRTEEALMAAKKRAEESDRLKSAFLANMSHEIRTPLNAVVGFSDLLAMFDNVSAEKKEYISLIHSNANKLLTLFEDILDLAKIESGQMILKEEEVTVYEIMQDVYQNEKLIYSESNLEFLLNCSKDLTNVKLYTDSVRVKQILGKLINNAFKFTEEGQVEIGCKQEDNRVIFYVRDTGIGVSIEGQQKIFNHFTQLSNSNSRFYEGTGLGLALSKELVALLGGNIGVNSKIGFGSVFWISFDKLS